MSQTVARLNFDDADLLGASFEDQNLFESSFLRANLTGADLSKANLTQTVFTWASLCRANLSWATLEGADFCETELIDANLSGCCALFTKFVQADLSGADLSGADLSNADFTDANLAGADLTGADLTGANLSGAKLYGVKGLLSPQTWLSQFEKDDKGILVFKPMKVTGSEIEPGTYLEEEVLFDRCSFFGSGVSFGTKEWCESFYPEDKGWICRVEYLDLAGVLVPYAPRGYARCNRLQLVAPLP